MAASLLEILRAIPDHRRAEGRRYELGAVVFCAILGMVAGANSYRQMHEFIRIRFPLLNEAFGLRLRGAPSYTGLRDILLNIDAEALERAFRLHASTLAGPPSEGWVAVAIDGKPLRGVAQFVEHRVAPRPHGLDPQSRDRPAQADRRDRVLGLLGRRKDGGAMARRHPRPLADRERKPLRARHDIRRGRLTHPDQSGHRRAPALLRLQSTQSLRMRKRPKRPLARRAGRQPHSQNARNSAELNSPGLASHRLCASRFARRPTTPRTAWRRFPRSAGQSAS